MPGEAMQSRADSGVESYWWMAPAAADYLLHVQKTGMTQVSGVADVSGIVKAMFHEQEGLGFVGDLSQ